MHVKFLPRNSSHVSAVVDALLSSSNLSYLFVTVNNESKELIFLMT